MKLHPIVSTALLCLATAPALFAGTSQPSTIADSAPMESPASDNGWWFRAASYAWVTAIDGDLTIAGLSAPVDVTMADTLDTLDLAFMGVFEAGMGKWSLGMDVIYAENSDDVPAGGVIFSRFDVELEQWVLTPFVACRAVETEDYRMDVFVGGRAVFYDAGITGRLVKGGKASVNGSTDFIDPIIGVRGQSELTDKFFVRYNGDIGGFGASSDLVWQAFVGLGYHFTPSVSAAIGYRGLGIDHDSGSLQLDTVNHGPVIGLEVRF
jgi:opacity protein-like surface antigen